MMLFAGSVYSGSKGLANLVGSTVSDNSCLLIVFLILSSVHVFSTFLLKVCLCKRNNFPLINNYLFPCIFIYSKTVYVKFYRARYSKFVFFSNLNVYSFEKQLLTIKYNIIKQIFIMSTVNRAEK